MGICGERPPNFNRTIRGTYFVGEFDDSSLEKYCEINRLIFVSPFRPFLVLVSVELYYEEKWRGEILEFAVKNKAKIKQAPVYRTDMHESSGSGRFEKIWLSFSEGLNEYYQIIMINKTSESQDIEWNFRALITKVIQCPRGARILNSRNFSCECVEGYFEDEGKSEYTCSKLTSNCKKGTSFVICDECFQPYKLTQDRKCELNDSKYIFFFFFLFFKIFFIIL
jgi:hypothetical protein